MKSIATALLFGTLLSGCYTHQPNYVPISDQNTTKELSWTNILEKTPAIDSFLVLNTGSVKVPTSGMLDKELTEASNLPAYMWVDVFAFLFHHRSNGWYLIDTGLDDSFQEDGNIKGLLSGNYILECRQKPEQNIASLLSLVRPELQGIYFTHLHGDHSAGLPELNKSIPKYIGEGEKFLHIPLIYTSNHLSSSDVLHEIQWSKSTQLDPFNQVVDVFGDASFLAIHTPGHSPGHTSYVLNTTSGDYLLTGDASHTAYGFENGIAPGWVDDKILAEQSLNKLRRFADLYPQVTVIFGHELPNETTIDNQSVLTNVLSSANPSQP